MKLVYESNPDILDIKEVEVMNDIEFTIRILSPSHFNTMKHVQKIFEENDILTDVLVYTYSNHEYRVVVRKVFYGDFILQLMKCQLLTKVEWKEELP
ncbi:hypothetical protein [Paenibacillus sedimenti]|uniref:Uncharacterized protein n=1 Tax=Paenibacillus sedimenti TaxID=2770274 RepID=A0A926QMJ1_9BACL|nr:hypothetical protein [Paenibacillus sedimenti]MBD0384700.1 hypothetical protein [Paenibacillus sedimenti]